MFQFWPCPGKNKCHFTPLKIPLSQKFSKYHADVILSRLRDTLDITNNLREVFKIQAVMGITSACEYHTDVISVSILNFWF